MVGMHSTRVLASLLACYGCGRVGFGIDADGGVRDIDTGVDAASYLFADDFEGPLEPWTALGNVDVYTGPPGAFEGASMLVADAQPSSSARAEVVLPTTLHTGSLFVRAYYYLPSSYAMADLSLVELIQPNGNLVLVNSPVVAFFSNFAGNGAASSYTVPRDTWTCIEVRIDIADSPDGTWHVSVDGVPRHTVTSIDTYGGGIEELHVGITWAGATQEAARVYVDSVVASTAPIGC